MLNPLVCTLIANRMTAPMTTRTTASPISPPPELLFMITRSQSRLGGPVCPATDPRDLPARNGIKHQPRPPGAPDGAVPGVRGGHSISCVRGGHSIVVKSMGGRADTGGGGVAGGDGDAGLPGDEIKPAVRAVGGRRCSGRRAGGAG